MKDNQPAQLLTVLEDILAPGKLREQMVGGTRQTIAAGGDIDLKTTIAHNPKIRRLTVDGDKAVVIVSQWADVVRLDSDGSYGARGLKHRLQGSLIYRDTWAKTKGQWKLTDTRVLNQKLLVDGKPRPQQGLPAK